MLDTNTDTCTFGAASLGFGIAVVGPEELESKWRGGLEHRGHDAKDGIYGNDTVDD